MQVLKALALGGALLGAAPASAGDWAEDLTVRSLSEGEASPAATIEDLSWLIGYWEGEGLGGVARETIAPAAAGQMMGAFSQQKSDGSLYFYEFYVFAEVGNSLALRIKHFTPDLVGWEERRDFVEFQLVAIEDRTAYFDGVTWSATGDGQLRAAVDIEDRGVVQFHYRAAALE